MHKFEEEALRQSLCCPLVTRQLGYPRLTPSPFTVVAPSLGSRCRCKRGTKRAEAREVFTEEVDSRHAVTNTE